MYGTSTPGKGAGTAAGIATVAVSTGVAGTVLPQAGASFANDLAITAAATLAVWAIVYAIRSKIKNDVR